MILLCAVARGQVLLNGINQYAAFSNSNLYATSAFTISATVNLDSIPSAGFVPSRVLTLHRTGSATVFGLGFTSNGLAIYYRTVTDTPVYPVVYPISTGVYYFVAATYDGSTYRAYVNGDLVWTTTATLYAIGAYPMFVGAYDHTQYFYDGTLEDVRVYSRTLSGSEISYLNNNAWALTDDYALKLRAFVLTNDTGIALTGIAKNYGAGLNGIYSNLPTVARPHVQTEKPLSMELP